MAMVQNHYVINVSQYVPQKDERFGKRYVHLFATETGSCITESDMLRVYTELHKRFAQPEFKIDVSQVRCAGYGVKLAEIEPGEFFVTGHK